MAKKPAKSAKKPAKSVKKPKSNSGTKKKTPTQPKISSAKRKKTASGKTPARAGKLAVDSSKLLKGMYADDYFPKFLVDKLRDVLLDACREIESQKPTNHEELCKITCRATDRINDLEEEFEENDSEIETAARDDIGISFGYIAGVYGFPDADPEDLIATRDW